MTRPTKNYRAAGVFIALTVVAAVAAEYYSVNRHGGIVEQPRYEMAITVQTNPAKGVGASPTSAENSVAPAVPVNGASSTTVVEAPSDDTQARPDARTDRRAASAGEAAKAGGVLVASDADVEAPVVVPATCAATLIADPTQGVCGWYRAGKGDFCKLRSPDSLGGWWEPCVNGRYYFAYQHAILGVSPLDCTDARVARASSEGWKNVTCVAAGRLRRLNPDDAAMTPLKIFSDHDRLAQEEPK